MTTQLIRLVRLMLCLGIGCRFAPAADLKCNTCHAAQAREQAETAMGRALQFPKSNRILASHPVLTTTKGAFTYRVETHAGASTYSVSDSTGEIRVPINYSFGEHSQTYVLEYQGRFYEGMVSYFAEIDGLDTTIGDDRLHPQTLLQALGRELDHSETVDCFGCHSTRSRRRESTEFNRAHPRGDLRALP